MARHPRQLSFNDRRSGPPPALIALLLLVLIAAGGFALGRGLLPDGLRPPFMAGTGVTPMVAPPEAPDPAPEPAAAAATETAVPATPEPAAPTATAAPAIDVASRWAERWSAGDYDGMYDLLSAASRRAIDRDSFVARHTAIAERAGLVSVAAIPTGASTPTGAWPIAVRFASSLVGDFADTVTLPVRLEEGEWRVDWSPGLVFSALEQDRCLDVDDVPVRRGAILDRDGDPLAIDGLVWRVSIIPAEMIPGDEPRVLKELAKLTGLAEKEVRARYEDVDPTWLTPIRDFPPERELEVLNAVGTLPGVSVTQARARLYPLGEDAAAITGYVTEPTAEQLAEDPTLRPDQRIGQAGVEAGADALLTGTPGVRLVAVECDSRAELAEIVSRPPVEPLDIVLTVDGDFQRAAMAALRARGDFRAAAAAIDPGTGAVLALASLPSFDPNGFALGFTAKERAALASEVRRPLLNRAAQGSYPTGSIFKVITFAGGMEHLDYAPDTMLDCPSSFQVEGAAQRWDDWTVAEGLGPQGPMTLHRALVTSCNTVFYGIGKDLDDLDSRLLPEMARGFGLGEPTGIPYLPEGSGIVPDPAWKAERIGDGWATGDAVNLAIGQGYLEATPLQMAVAYAAIANGGTLLQPWIVSETVGPDGARIPEGGRVTRGRVPISDATVAALQAALRDQTTDPFGAGSSRVFADFAWPIAGKTGTAQHADPKRKPHSWFAAFGPYGGTPEIATAVVVENAGEGVAVAAPATRAIYEAWANRAD